MNSYDITEPQRCYVSIYDAGEVIEVPYEWGLAGPGGAWFILKPFAGTSEAHVEEAKNCLRRGRDVVTLRVERQPAWTKCSRCSHLHAPGDCALRD